MKEKTVSSLNDVDLRFKAGVPMELLIENGVARLHPLCLGVPITTSRPYCTGAAGSQRVTATPVGHVAAAGWGGGVGGV